MTNKITKKEFFGMLDKVVDASNVANKEELKAFIAHEIELINKKAENRKTGTSKKAKENSDLTEVIITELKRVGQTTVTDLLKRSSVLSEYITSEGKPLSNQKVTALLKPLYLGDNPIVERIMEKKSVYFKVID